ncbi:putative sulfate/molybdate transporter [Desulfogranum mediterraneum]|uniref:putative sulfate/molybdate transporter n=1 Tax=Desulfogranum mediterraneum TaxID=160661 RepID=UPI00048E8C07|nr:putative sulfate/molybdate transporter [Desulfogranum mediterraneum]
MSDRFAWNRMELAGSLGDLGTLLPIAMAMVLVNGLNPVGVFFSIGLFYICSGLFFGVTVPVQPMKVIGAYAIATALTPSQIMASSLLIGGFLLLIGLTGAIDLIRRYTPRAVIRGVQLSTGILLLSGGIKFIIGSSRFQQLQHAAEPYLALQSLGPLQVGVVIGLVGGLVTLLLLDNKRYPAGLVVVVGGILSGLLLGARVELATAELGFALPELLPFPFPAKADFSFALLVLVLPQLPMTVGNAVLAYADLSQQYFAERSARVTNRNVCLSMALANFLSFCCGGIPLCHGAGGLAAHYRFGARTAASNLMIGGIFLVLALFCGGQIIGLLNLLPMAVMGVLLVFAGAQLALSVMDLEARKDLFVAMLILGITLAANLAVGFMVGLVVAWLLKWEKLSI